MGIVPYGVGKTPVGRGQCAPPLRMQSVSSGVIVCHSDRGWTIFVKMKKDA